MPINHAVWKVGSEPQPLAEVSLQSEALLEKMIVSDPSILSLHWLLIGQQVRTDFGGIIDLLAVNQDGQLIVIELKRNQTPREVVAQALDYASWVRDLTSDEIAHIFNKFSRNGSLGEAFQKKFGIQLDEEQLNGSHQIVVVASSLDSSTERIVNYLNDMNVAINVIFFQVFQDGANQYLSRAWLIDPIETETRATSVQSGERGEWNGEYYSSFGHSEDRDWNEAIKYGFICAGGGQWYTKTLSLLSPGDRVWVNVPGQGYVGVGKVLGQSVRANEFQVDVNGEKQDFLDIAQANYHRQYVDDEENSEYFVSVEWVATKPVNAAVSEVGFFGNQNSVCRPRTTKWIHTVERLKKVFSIND
ncbi:endonuclease NucS [uncultured Desulfuromusa sp.]|uniref:endonuclease NucS n=1 Tax=uncultured Desulfuromusa sp. TaxID=219183 RepID=UPI002AA6149B|nr:endonuclease NucS [uncultured Desulfuromusa sp.]